MYKFMLSAPGSISLYGGPTMRLKQQYVSASLDMRTTLSFALLPAGEVSTNFIEIDFSNIKLNVRTPLRIFNEYFIGNSVLTDRHLHDKIKHFINSRYRDSYEFINDAQLYLEAFFYLLVRISQKREIRMTQSFSVHMSTEVPIDLGRSASVAVCLAGCFWRWSLLQEGIRNQFEHDDLENIVKYAKNCDYVIYNSLSLINIITSTHGGINVFEGYIVTDYFPKMPNMRILLVFSNQKIIMQMRNIQMEMIKLLSTYVSPILESIDSISIKFIQTLNEINHAEARLLNNGNAENQTSLINNYQILLTLVHMNQGLLKALGMSNPNLDIICAIARDFSLAGKIASQNISEYAFILLPPDTTDEVIDCLLKKLELHNFTAKITRVCCNGLITE